MNHLQWNAKSSRPALEVPYMCSDEVQCIGVDDFAKWSSLSNSPGARPTGKPAEDGKCYLQLAKELQFWLYFGLLSIVLQNFYERTDFLRTSSSSGLIVDSTALPSMLRDYVTKDSLSKTDGNVELSAYGLLVLRALKMAIQSWKTIAIPAIRSNENLLGPQTVWNSGVYRVFLSIGVLIEMLHGHLTRIDPAIGKNLPSCPVIEVETTGTAESLVSIGRCPSLPKRLGLTSEQAYCLLSIPSTASANAHLP